MDVFLFYFFGGITLLAAIAVVALRKVFYSAVALIVSLGSLAGLYLLLKAPFIAAVQVIIYAGAIMVLFLFVIMLLDPFSASDEPDRKKHLKTAGLVLGGAALVLLFPMLKSYSLAMTPKAPDIMAQDVGSVAELARTLFREYLLPFEVTSILILVAIIGAVVLAKRKP